MTHDPAATDDLPKLTGSQLNALLTVFVAAGLLPEEKVPQQSEIFKLDDLKAGNYTAENGRRAKYPFFVGAYFS